MWGGDVEDLVPGGLSHYRKSHSVPQFPFNCVVFVQMLAERVLSSSISAEF